MNKEINWEELECWDRIRTIAKPDTPVQDEPLGDNTNMDRKIVELHGREEIEQFLREDYVIQGLAIDKDNLGEKLEKELQQVIDLMLACPNVVIGLPSQVWIDNVPVSRNRKASGVLVYHNKNN